LVAKIFNFFHIKVAQKCLNKSNAKELYPTHTHGLTSSGLPEMFINVLPGCLGDGNLTVELAKPPLEQHLDKGLGPPVTRPGTGGMEGTHVDGL